MQRISIFQIYYSEQTKAILDPGFLPLDNSANERPDWREYWPIRNFLLRAPPSPDDRELCGFFSPKFKDKTRLGADAVRSFIELREADVFLFSPFADVGSFFVNVFQQGEAFHPGLLAAAQQFVDTIGLGVKLNDVVTDSTNTVFCNYIVANHKFWAKWFDLTEKLFAICEGEATPLQQALALPSSLRTPPSPLKVFLMERIASLVLFLHPELRVSAYNPFELPFSKTIFSNHPREALVCDALKIAYREQGYPHYMHAFAGIAQATVNRKR